MSSKDWDDISKQFKVKVSLVDPKQTQLVTYSSVCHQTNLKSQNQANTAGNWTSKHFKYRHKPFHSTDTVFNGEKFNLKYQE